MAAIDVMARTTEITVAWVQSCGQAGKQLSADDVAKFVDAIAEQIETTTNKYKKMGV